MSKGNQTSSNEELTMEEMLGSIPDHYLDGFAQTLTSFEKNLLNTNLSEDQDNVGVSEFAFNTIIQAVGKKGDVVIPEQFLSNVLKRIKENLTPKEFDNLRKGTSFTDDQIVREIFTNTINKIKGREEGFVLLNDKNRNDRDLKFMISYFSPENLMQMEDKKRYLLRETESAFKRVEQSGEYELHSKGFNEAVVARVKKSKEFSKFNANTDEEKKLFEIEFEGYINSLLAIQASQSIIKEETQSLLKDIESGKVPEEYQPFNKNFIKRVSKKAQKRTAALFNEGFAMDARIAAKKEAQAYLLTETVGQKFDKLNVQDGETLDYELIRKEAISAIPKYASPQIRDNLESKIRQEIEKIKIFNVNFAVGQVMDNSDLKPGTPDFDVAVHDAFIKKFGKKRHESVTEVLNQTLTKVREHEFKKTLVTDVVRDYLNNLDEDSVQQDAQNRTEDVLNYVANRDGIKGESKKLIEELVQAALLKIRMEDGKSNSQNGGLADIAEEFSDEPDYESQPEGKARASSKRGSSSKASNLAGWLLAGSTILSNIGKVGAVSTITATVPDHVRDDGTTVYSQYQHGGNPITVTVDQNSASANFGKMVIANGARTHVINPAKDLAGTLQNINGPANNYDFVAAHIINTDAGQMLALFINSNFITLGESSPAADPDLNLRDGYIIKIPLSDISLSADTTLTPYPEVITADAGVILSNIIQGTTGNQVITGITLCSSTSQTGNTGLPLPDMFRVEYTDTDIAQTPKFINIKTGKVVHIDELTFANNGKCPYMFQASASASSSASSSLSSSLSASLSSSPSTSNNEATNSASTSNSGSGSSSLSSSLSTSGSNSGSASLSGSASSSASNSASSSLSSSPSASWSASSSASSSGSSSPSWSLSSSPSSSASSSISNSGSNSLSSSRSSSSSSSISSSGSASPSASPSASSSWSESLSLSSSMSPSSSISSSTLVSASPSSLSASPSYSASSSASASASMEDQSNDDTGLSGGAIAGIVVGALALLGIGGAVAYFKTRGNTAAVDSDNVKADEEIPSGRPKPVPSLSAALATRHVGPDLV